MDPLVNETEFKYPILLSSIDAGKKSSLRSWKKVYKLARRAPRWLASGVRPSISYKSSTNSDTDSVILETPTWCQTDAEMIALA
jgi:hypothetical protein